MLEELLKEKRLFAVKSQRRFLLPPFNKYLPVGRCSVELQVKNKKPIYKSLQCLDVTDHQTSETSYQVEGRECSNWNETFKSGHMCNP